jgi:hypothetical protein
MTVHSAARPPRLGGICQRTADDIHSSAGGNKWREGIKLRWQPSVTLPQPSLARPGKNKPAPPNDFKIRNGGSFCQPRFLGRCVWGRLRTIPPLRPGSPNAVSRVLGVVRFRRLMLRPATGTAPRAVRRAECSQQVARPDGAARRPYHGKTHSQVRRESLANPLVCCAEVPQSPQDGRRLATEIR